MPLELHEDAMGDWRNALFLANASDIAYYSQAEAAPKFKELLGVDAQLFSVGNTQAFVLTNADHIVVAFRGTESPTSIDGLKDWLLNDALNLLIVPEGRMGTDFIAAGVDARFHQGFINALMAIWDPMFERVTAELKMAERPLWITGHSLGGALALLAAWLFLRKFVAVHQIYTFGGPMIGNPAAVAAFDREFRGKIYRFVDTRDPVPQLPTVSLVAADYSHCQKAMDLGVREPGSFWKSVAANVVGGVFTGGGLTTVWNFIKERVGAHSMTTYIEHIKKQI